MMEELLFGGWFEDGIGVFVEWLENMIPMIIIGMEG